MRREEVATQMHENTVCFERKLCDFRGTTLPIEPNRSGGCIFTTLLRCVCSLNVWSLSRQFAIHNSEPKVFLVETKHSKPRRTRQNRQQTAVNREIQDVTELCNEECVDALTEAIEQIYPTSKSPSSCSASSPNSRRIVRNTQMRLPRCRYSVMSTYTTRCDSPGRTGNNFQTL